MENIISTVRIRPTRAGILDEIFCEPYEEKSVMNTKTAEKFTFEQVYTKEATNQTVFSSLGQNLIDDFFKGINVCVFAYGQTSSGKTFTMKGNNENPGLIPQSIQRIFSIINEADSDKKYEVKCSYIEIYNESLIDLLDPENKNLEIRENIQKGIHIPGLHEPQASSFEEANTLFEKGESSRKFGETQANHNSSRSHTVFKISIEIRNKQNPDKIIYSSLNLIDLAGSESISKSKAEGIRQREGANINKSLLALCNVIGRLATKETSFINYRDSKLTRILQPFLGGNSKTAVICNINPLLSNYAETINTLKFGMSAGAIKNQVKINERYSMPSQVGRQSLPSPGGDNQFTKMNQGGNGGSAKKENSGSRLSFNSKRLSITNEYEELKSELEKNKMVNEKANEEQKQKIEQLEKEVVEMKHNQQIVEEHNSSLDQENKMLQARLKIMEEETNKLRGDNDQLIQLLNELDSKNQAHEEQQVEQKAQDKQQAVDMEAIQNQFEEFEKKYVEVQRENQLLAQENGRLKSDIDKLEQIRVESNKEKNDLISHYKDHINHLKTVIETMQSEKENFYREKSKKDGIQFNSFNTQNIINVGVNKMDSQSKEQQQQQQQHHPQQSAFDMGYGSFDNDFELKLLEIETEFKTQMIQKNKQINNLNQKIVGLTKELTKKEELIVRYQQKEFGFLSNSATTTPFKENYGGEYSTTNTNTPVNSELAVLKKRKMGELEISKRIKNSPDRDQLKKEVKFLANRSKNFEKQLEKQRNKEEEYTVMIQELTRQNQDLELKLGGGLKFPFSN